MADIRIYGAQPKYGLTVEQIRLVKRFPKVSWMFDSEFGSLIGWWKMTAHGSVRVELRNDTDRPTVYLSLWYETDDMDKLEKTADNFTSTLKHYEEELKHGHGEAGEVCGDREDTPGTGDEVGGTEG